MPEFTPAQRRTELHRLLSCGRKVVASAIAKEWGCAERTIRRDLQKMRDVDGLPVQHDPIAQTWRYSQPVAEVPAILVGAEDRRALLFSLQAAAQFEDTPVCAQIRRVCQSLLDTLPPENKTQFQRMMNSVRFTGPRTPPIKKQVWEVLLLALEARETMTITYTDGIGGITTGRDVDPYGLMVRDRHWIMPAYCHLRKAVLTFALHRISEAQTTDKPFTMPPGFMDRYLASSFDGIASTGPSTKVTLRIDKDAPLFIKDRQWHPQEQRAHDKKGNTIVKFQTTALFALEREIRADEGWVEVLQPAEGRKRLRQSARAIAKAHK